MQGPKMTITTHCSKNILIVEDDRDIRESMKDALELEGYQVTTANNGIEGLVSLRKAKETCIILLDMLMPRMDGLEFMSIVKADKDLSPIPIFIHSAVANKENTVGAVGWIKKPADLETILTTVKNYCVKTN